MEFGDWHQDSSTSLYHKDSELKGKPKDIVVMKDGIITQHHLEETINAQLVVKYLSKEEKLGINEAYEKWKMQKRE